MSDRKDFLNLTSKIAKNEKTAEKFAEHLEELFAVIIPERIGSEFKKALEDGNIPLALKICGEYYRNKPFKDERLAAKGAYSVAEGEKTVSGVMREVSVDWTFPNGEIDFLFNPTLQNPPVNHEWLWQLNRHSYWGNLAKTYVGTGDEKYALAFRDQLLRWIEQTDIPENWNGHGSAWRTIECGIRLLGVWNTAFEGFRHSPSIEDVTLLLMIASMHRQSLHLAAHTTKGNWLMMEANGIYTFSALFDELSDSEANRKFAADKLLAELEKQILPDGMHDELSPDYQSVVFGCGSNFYGLAQRLGFQNEINDGLKDLIEKTVDAAIKLSTPAFTQPRTNDTYTIHTKNFTLPAAALLGQKPEYAFVNSNRAEGQPPCGKTASVFLPWAGFAVMRSDWTEKASYLCFDVGPLGMGHLHHDKLNINIYKGDEELIFDDGGGQYDESLARHYGRSAYDHNTVLVDGMGQQRPGPKKLEKEAEAEWISGEHFDYAAAVYEDTFGKDEIKVASFRREVLFCKPEFFCIADTLTSTDGRPHDYEVIFHLDTTKVKPLPQYENGLISDFGKKYDIALIPLGENAAETQLKAVSAQTEPQYRGWYVGRNESCLHPAITVSRTVRGLKNHRFITLAFPMEKGDALPEIKMENSIAQISFKGKSFKIDVDDLKNFKN